MRIQRPRNDEERPARCWRLRTLARDEGGQSLLVGVLCVLLLVLMLTVVTNLSFTVYEKMEAQNAADAAALTAGTWQVRGLHFVQEMNNLVYTLDAAGQACLAIAGICGAASASPAAPVTEVVGNIAIVGFIGASGLSHFGICPIRWVAQAGFPVIGYLGASQMAKANGATSILRTGKFLERLGCEFVDMKVRKILSDTIGDEGLGNEAVGAVDNELDDIVKRLGATENEQPSGDDRHPFFAEVFAAVCDNLCTVGLECSLSPGLFDWDDLTARIPQTIADSASAKQAAVDLASDLRGKLEAIIQDSSIRLATLHLKWEPSDEDQDNADISDADVSDSDSIEEFIKDPSGTAKSKVKKYVQDKAKDVVKRVSEELSFGDFPLCLDAKTGDAFKTMAKPLLFSVALDGWLKLLKFSAPTKISGVWLANGDDYWNHGWYVTEDDSQDGDQSALSGTTVGELVEPSYTTLPTSTWLTMAGVEDPVYRKQTSAWSKMHGLGVHDYCAGEYLGLGSMALASVQVKTDRVVKFRVTGTHGWVRLVPVAIVSNEVDSLSLGICH